MRFLYLLFVALVGAGIASTGKGSSPLSGLAAAQAAALKASASKATPPPAAGKSRPPADYDYDYAAPPAGKANAKAPASAAGKAAITGKAPTTAGKGPATAGKAVPAGKAGKAVTIRGPQKAQSNILPAQAAVLKPTNITPPIGPNDYDYDYVTTDQGQKIPKCICPHEWEPVCGIVDQRGMISRVTFSNRCQALCRSSNISLGVCPGDSEVYEKCYFDNCRADDVNPICVHNTDFPNPCTANCRFAALGLPPPPFDIMASGPCQSECAKNRTAACPADRLCWPKPGKCFQPPCVDYKCIDPACADPDKCGPKKFNYVCANGVTYTNRCWASCEGYTTGVTKGVCPDGKRDPWFPRVIPYDPIAQGLPDPLAKPTPAVAPLQCVPGLFLNGTSCLPCPSGFTSAPAATNCTPCPPGSYAAVRASPQCTPCPNGTFTKQVGSSTCQACTPPYVTLKPGSVSCQLPPLNMYGRSGDCNVDDPCQCAQLVGDCGWSSSYSKCMKDKDTDCKECPKMNVCRDLVNATDSSRKPPAVRDLAVTESQPQLLKAQWVQPVKNFVCNVDMYKVQLRKEDGPWQLIEWPSFGIYGIDPVISIGGLTPSTGYTVMVTPVSLSGGEGPSSQVPARTAKI